MPFVIWLMNCTGMNEMTDEFTQAVAELDSPVARMLEEKDAEIESLRKDVARYRWLLEMLQAAYDGDTNNDFDAVTVFCSMQYGRHDHRRVEAYITWADMRDEPLNLSAAIDAAMETLK